MISYSWQKISKVTSEDITSWMKDEFLIQGPRQIVAGVHTFSTVFGALELAATGGNYHPATADYCKYQLNLLDLALSRVSDAITCLVDARADRTRNKELMFAAVRLAMGDGPRAAELVRECHKLFPDHHIDADGDMDDSFPARYADDTFDRVQALDALASEFAREVRQAAMNMPKWPCLESLKPDREDREEFETLAARLDLGAACPPEYFAQEETCSPSPAPDPKPTASEPFPSFSSPPATTSEVHNPNPIPNPSPRAQTESVPPPPYFSPRKGKIGRLPAKIRHELNLRLSDGVETTPLLAWLNAQPEVEHIMRRDFAARPVTPQNLSEWRQGGFQDWLRNQQTLEIARDLVDQSASLDELMGSEPFSQRLTTIMSAQFMQVATPLLEDAGADVEKRWHRTQQLLKELSRLRRNDIQYARLKFETSSPRPIPGSGSYTDLTKMDRLRRAAKAA